MSRLSRISASLGDCGTLKDLLKFVGAGILIKVQSSVKAKAKADNCKTRDACTGSDAMQCEIVWIEVLSRHMRVCEAETTMEEDVKGGNGRVSGNRRRQDLKHIDGT